MRTNIICIIVILTVLASCHKQSPLTKKFGTDFNYKRKELGLPLLPENWKLVDDKEGSLVWMPSRNADSLVYYKFNDMDIAFSKPVTKNQVDPIITKWGLNSIW